MSKSKLISNYQKMSPEESLRKGWELTEEYIKTNPKKHMEELERRMKDSYILR